MIKQIFGFYSSIDRIDIMNDFRVNFFINHIFNQLNLFTASIIIKAFFTIKNEGKFYWIFPVQVNPISLYYFD
jgi:hypothetical protein